jgi:triosephosphate isomerase
MRYLILNYKTYLEGSGERAKALTQIVSEVSKPEGLEIVVAPQITELATLKSQFPQVSFWTQHVEAYEPGKTTGRVTIPAAKLAGSTGSLLNHSERPLSDTSLVTVLELSKKYSYTTCVCVPDLEKAESIFPLQPDMVSFEPPELISTPTSLVDTDISMAIDFVERYQDKRIPLILGAGVRDTNDVSKALEIGYSGVLLSSGFVLSNSPKMFLENIVSAFARAF